MRGITPRWGAPVAALLGSALLFAASAPAGAATSWRQIPAPDAPGASLNELNAVSAVSPSEAWAVGDSRGSSGIRNALAEHWTAARGWQLSTTARLSSTSDAILNGVAGVSATNAWAAGRVFTTVEHGLIEHWNGTAWTVAARPASEPPGGELHAISASSAADVWAVGLAQNPDTLVRGALIEHFNGTAWSVVPSPDLGVDAFLSGVRAVAPNDAWAVGRVNEAALVEHWDGTAWTRVAIAPPTGESGLSGVTATAANDVWVVGSQRSGTHTLAEHWNGTAWSVIPTQEPAGLNGALVSVVPRAANDVWAVGAGFQISVFPSPLIEHWNGTAWTIVASPNPSSTFNSLAGVTTSAGGPLLAVGQSDTSDGSGVTHTFAIEAD
ncbi:MAG: hypothetical protein ACJ73S_31265 [Mycobacteriales bacterium]